jgi:hypothetical protein
VGVRHVGEITSFKKILGDKECLGKFGFALIECDKPTVNGRIYPKEILEKMVEDHQDRIKQRRFFCYPRWGDREKSDLVGVSHLITSLETRGNTVVGTAEVLNTPAGREVLKELAKGVVGVILGGIGKVESKKVVEFDLTDIFFASKKDLGIEEVGKFSFFMWCLKIFT